MNADPSGWIIAMLTGAHPMPAGTSCLLGACNRPRRVASCFGFSLLPDAACTFCTTDCTWAAFSAAPPGRPEPGELLNGPALPVDPGWVVGPAALESPSGAKGSFD